MIHFTPDHHFTASLHFTSLHITSLHYTPFPHFSLPCTFGRFVTPLQKTLHFSSLIITFSNLFLKICDLQSLAPLQAIGSTFRLSYLPWSIYRYIHIFPPIVRQFSGPRPVQYRGFVITLIHITVGRAPLDE